MVGFRFALLVGAKPARASLLGLGGKFVCRPVPSSAAPATPPRAVPTRNVSRPPERISSERLTKAAGKA